MFLRFSICLLSLLFLVSQPGCIQSSPVTPDIETPETNSEVISAFDQFISEICQIGIENGKLPESENPDLGDDESG